LMTSLSICPSIRRCMCSLRLEVFWAPCHAYLGFKNHYHRCMILMVMESFSIVLDMVVSETYSLNKQSSKRH
jgi:hypothetical protein